MQSRYTSKSQSQPRSPSQCSFPKPTARQSIKNSSKVRPRKSLLCVCIVRIGLIVEGILVAKKDFNAPGHIDLHKIPNLQVIKACQSLTSRGYVKTQFSWQYYYYTLTNEGIGTSP